MIGIAPAPVPRQARAPHDPSAGRTRARHLGGTATLRQTAPTQSLHKLLRLAKQIDTLMADPAPRFGFVAFAETWNGRLAMLGFVIGLATELLTGQSILGQLGLG